MTSTRKERFKEARQWVGSGKIMNSGVRSELESCPIAEKNMKFSRLNFSFTKWNCR